MTKLKNILHGVGSVINLSPCTDYSRFVPRDSIADRVRRNWERTGENMKRAINQFEHDEENKKAR